MKITNKEIHGMIKHCKDVIKSTGYRECKSDHKKLIQCLEELLTLRGD